MIPLICQMGTSVLVTCTCSQTSSGNLVRVNLQGLAWHLDFSRKNTEFPGPLFFTWPPPSFHTSERLSWCWIMVLHHKLWWVNVNLKHIGLVSSTSFLFLPHGSCFPHGIYRAKDVFRNHSGARWLSKVKQHFVPSPDLEPALPLNCSLLLLSTWLLHFFSSFNKITILEGTGDCKPKLLEARMPG